MKNNVELRDEKNLNPHKSKLILWFGKKENGRTDFLTSFLITSYLAELFSFLGC